MPADRRALRKSLKLLREQRVLLGFDFDCTLSIRHFYKVFAWLSVTGATSMIWHHSLRCKFHGDNNSRWMWCWMCSAGNREKMPCTKYCERFSSVVQNALISLQIG
eukprot:symbB.v1.2.037021.t1/scaffold5359.1/size28108/1